MTVVPLAEADVDVCGGCQGIWIDWFDGEVAEVTRDVLAATSKAPVSSPASTMRNEARAIGGCPRCHGVQLVVERYRLDEPRDRTRLGGKPAPPRTSTTGAELLRCEHCAGSFVSATSAALLATLPPDEPAPPSESEKAVEPLPWRKLLAVLAGVFGKR